MIRPRRLRQLGCAALLFGVSCANVPAQLSLPAANVARSISGQFIVTRQPSGPQSFMPVVRPDTNSVRLEPALLAVSAERIKRALWHELGIDPGTPWAGKIFLVLHTARSPDEDVTIISEHFADGWDYHVALPDVLSRTRFLRALTGVVLLEFANRNANTRSAEVPPWLIDGLSQQLLATGAVEVILSSPVKPVNGFLASRTDVTQRGVDPLARARRVLADHPALTFEQLSWPTGAQLAGADGGVYRASAQLFVSELLKLNNGPAHLRAMLHLLPRYYNWQTAFQDAFHADFLRPLDVEKWWQLQVVDFVARDPGPTWTPAVSRIKLDQILTVAVDFRTASNALPVPATVSLQAVIRNLDAARQTAILETRLRDLELAQFRMAWVLAPLTAEYRKAIADYLGEEREVPQPPGNKHRMPQPKHAQKTLERLNALDAQRRAIESTIKPDVWQR